jgi:hypothetical protein
MCENEIYEITLKLIEDIFGDYRKITGKASDEIQSIARLHEIPAEIYITENNELISYGMTKENFGNIEIEKHKRYGEALYEKNGNPISIYILGSPHSEFNVTKEIESESPMIIIFSKFPYSSTYDTLRHIENLVKNRKKLDKEDLNALKLIPMMGPPEDKRQLRIECLKLWKKIVQRGLVK